MFIKLVSLDGALTYGKALGYWQTDSHVTTKLGNKLVRNASVLAEVIHHRLV